MKKIIGISLLALVCLTAFLVLPPTHRTIIQKLDFDYLEGCETGKGKCEPIEIARKNLRDSILLVFPSGGIESDVYLTSTKGPKIQLHDKKLSGEGKPTLNLTRLPDGEYRAGIISCGLGGSCIIQIKTL
jgi:hypothetical protein